MLSKSYSLLNFLNRSHSPAFRHGVGGAAYAGTLAVTGRPSIAHLVRTQFVRDETKYAFRLAGWVLRRGWPGVETVTDDFFDFTLGASPADLEALEGFIAARRNHLPEHLWRADDLFVRAARIHAQLDAGARDIEVLRADFREHADALLPLISTAQGQPSGLSAGREGDFSVDDARTALADLAAALPVQQWHWYVISGTFLGIVREGGFLAHDYDVDVGVTFDPEHPEVLDRLVEALERSPQYVVKKLDHYEAVVETAPARYAVERAPALVKLIHENGINVDVFVHHLRGRPAVARLVDPSLGEHPLRAGRLHLGRGAGARPGRRRPLPDRELRRLAHTGHRVQLHDRHAQPGHQPHLPLRGTVPHPVGPLRARRPGRVRRAAGHPDRGRDAARRGRRAPPRARHLMPGHRASRPGAVSSPRPPDECASPSSFAETRFTALISRMAAVTRRRGIMWTLVQRDLRVRYSRSLLGYVWTVLDPLLMASVYFLVFTFIFKAGGRVADRPYFLYLLSGLLAWQWFTGSVNDTAKSLIQEAKLVRSTNLPREIWVIRCVVAKGVEFVLSLPVLVGFVLYYLVRGRVELDWELVFFPLGMLLQFVLLVGLGLLLAPVSRCSPPTCSASCASCCASCST